MGTGLEAFMQNLDYPEDTYVIATDRDYTDNADATYLFGATIASPANGEDVSLLKYLYEYSYINDFYEEGNYYTVAGFNASFGGDNVNLEADVITEFIADDTVIVQAAPNLGQWGINWGEHFPNVISCAGIQINQGACRNYIVVLCKWL